jgi:hypothetical protein
MEDPSLDSGADINLGRVVAVAGEVHLVEIKLGDPAETERTNIKHEFLA